MYFVFNIFDSVKGTTFISPDSFVTQTQSSRELARSLSSFGIVLNVDSLYFLSAPKPFHRPNNPLGWRDSGPSVFIDSHHTQHIKAQEHRNDDGIDLWMHSTSTSRPLDLVRFPA